MKKDKLKVYVLELLFFLILLLALFKSSIIDLKNLSILILIFQFIVIGVLKKRNLLSINSKKVEIILSILGISYVCLFYLAGLYFGFYESPIKFNLYGLLNFIIPTVIIIISSEIIRYVNLSQKSKIGRVIITILLIFLDVLLYSRSYNIFNLEDFLVIIGFILFASISCNLLYNYISKRYGYKSIILYRLITSLYVYIIPIIPNVYIFFRSVVKMVFPYIIYLILEYSFSKNNIIDDYKNKKGRIITNTVLLVFTLLITMLISCKFKYGILVIGSGSMTGTIDKGDAIVFTKYNPKKNMISKDDVIVFKKDDIYVVHRVINKKQVNDKTYYYTKGDANLSMDEGFLKDEDIVGKVNFKISYIGYPSLWIKDIFTK